VLASEGRKGLVGVEQWAELRREHFVRGVSIKVLARWTGLSRNMIRAALRSPEPPRYERAPAGSKLDPFKGEIHQLLKKEPAMPGQRVRELIETLGFDGGKTIVDDYLREVRPLFAPPRTFQRTVYRPGEICRSICGNRAARSRPATVAPLLLEPLKSPGASAADPLVQIGPPQGPRARGEVRRADLPSRQRLGDREGGRSRQRDARSAQGGVLRGDQGARSRGQSGQRDRRAARATAVLDALQHQADRGRRPHLGRHGGVGRVDSHDAASAESGTEAEAPPDEVAPATVP
jgi:hypothetical protein